MKRRAARIAAVVLLLFLSAGSTIAAQIQGKAPALAGRCATFLHDSHPTATVRLVPNGAPVRTLADDTELEVDEDRGGWLHISAPVIGWIHESVTVVYCGSKSLVDDHAVLGALSQLSARAQSDRLAADTLMRYTAFGAADGYAGEAADDDLGALMVANPKLLISVLDQLPQSKREEVLRGMALTGAADEVRKHAFDKAVKAEPSHPTSVTWRKLQEECGPS